MSAVERGADRGAERRTDVGTGLGPEGERLQDRFVGDRDLTQWRSRPGRALDASAQAIARRTGPSATLILTLVVGAAIAVLLSAIAAEIYEAVAERDGVAGVDQPLLDWFLTLRSPVGDTVVTLFTDLAGTIGMPIIAVTAILVLGIRRRSWTPAVVIGAAGAGSLLMTIAGKVLIGRERPPLTDAVPPYEVSASFPSGHTLNAVAVVGAIAYLVVLRRTTVRARAALVLGAVAFAILVGVSRVFLGHHWFTDVLAGWALGAAWLALVVTAHRLYLTVQRCRDDEVEGPRAGEPAR